MGVESWGSVDPGAAEGTGPRRVLIYARWTWSVDAFGVDLEVIASCAAVKEEMI